MESSYIQTIITTWNTKLYHERIACLYHHLPWHKHLRHGWKSLFVVVTDRMLEKKWTGSQKISLYSQFGHINNLKTLAKSECRQHKTKCPSQLSLGTIGTGRSFMTRALDESEIIVTELRVSWIPWPPVLSSPLPHHGGPQEASQDCLKTTRVVLNAFNHYRMQIKTTTSRTWNFQGSKAALQRITLWQWIQPLCICPKLLGCPMPEGNCGLGDMMVH